MNDIAIKAVKSLADCARDMIKYMAVSSSNPKDKEIATSMITAHEEAMLAVLRLDGAVSTLEPANQAAPGGKLYGQHLHGLYNDHRGQSIPR